MISGDIMFERNIIRKSEKLMLECVNQDSAHDEFHIYRVLNLALVIAETEQDVDLNVLIVSCLLHEEDRAGRYINKLSKIKAFRNSVTARLAEYYKNLQKTQFGWVENKL